MTSEGHRLADLAERHGLRLQGEPDYRITGVAPLSTATPVHLSFLANRKYRSQLETTAAGAVVMDARTADGYGGNALVSDNPYAAFARIAAEFEARPAARPGVHPTAVIAPDAAVDPSAAIGPYTVIGARTRVEAGADVGPHWVIGHGGAGGGAGGVGLALGRGAWLQGRQLGGARMGADCEIGPSTTIDRGALGDTVLEEDVRLDNLIPIAHSVYIGAHTALAGCSAIAG